MPIKELSNMQMAWQRHEPAKDNNSPHNAENVEKLPVLPAKTNERHDIKRCCEKKEEGKRKYQPKPTTIEVCRHVVETGNRSPRGEAPAGKNCEPSHNLFGASFHLPPIVKGQPRALARVGCTVWIRVSLLRFQLPKSRQRILDARVGPGIRASPERIPRISSLDNQNICGLICEYRPPVNHNAGNSNRK
jgi:hypothetical protein